MVTSKRRSLKGRFESTRIAIVCAATAVATSAAPLEAAAPPQAPAGGAFVHPPEPDPDGAFRRSWSDLLIAAQDTDPQSVAVVTGEASVDAEPDRARIQLAVETEGTSAREASEANAQQIEGVTAAILSAGEGAQGLRVETSSYSLNPVYSTGGGDRGREITGYSARNTLQVTLDQVERVGGLIDAALAAGANRVSSLRFEVRDPRPYRAQALRDAIGIARAEAEVVAESLGMTLGPALEVQGGSEAPYPRPFVQSAGARGIAMAEAVPTPVEPGSQSISARVTIRFQLMADP